MTKSERINELTLQLNELRMPGMAASTRETFEFGSAPNEVEAPENSFDSDVTCAWTSMPMTTSQSPVAPEIKRLGSGLRVSIRDITGSTIL